MINGLTFLFFLITGIKQYPTCKRIAEIVNSLPRTYNHYNNYEVNKVNKSPAYFFKYIQSIGLHRQVSL